MVMGLFCMQMEIGMKVLGKTTSNKAKAFSIHY